LSADGGSTPARLPGGAVATVVDAQGLPVQGLEVAACVLDPDGALVGSIAWDGAARTAVDGTVPLPDGAEYVATRLVTGLAVTSDAAAPHRIQLPPTGAIHIDLEAWPAGLRVLLTRDAPDKSIEMLDVDDGNQVYVDRVPLGEEFLLTLQARSANGFERFRGPVRTGEVVEIAPRPEYRCRVRVRLLDEDGAPVDAHSVSLRCGEWERSITGDGSHGLYSSTGPRSSWDVAVGDQIEVKVVLNWFDQPALHCHGRAVVPGSASNTSIDLGTVVVARPPLVTSGTVVDATGEGVEGALVRVDAPGYDGRREQLGAQVTVEGGAFELRAPRSRIDAAARPLTLHVLPEGSPVEWTRTVAAGEAGVEVVLPGDGAISIDASLVDEGLAERLAVRVSAWTPPREFRVSLGRPVTRGPLARVDRITVPPGRYAVSFTLDDSELHRTAPLEVRSGEVTPVAAADLRALGQRFELVTLRVLDGDGAPVEGATAHRRRADSTRVLWAPDADAQSDVDGMLECLVALDGSSALMVTAVGHGIATVDVPRPGDSVVLPSMREVELVFEDPQPPEGTGRLTVSSNLHDPKELARMHQVTRNAGGAWSVRLPGAGVYSVGLTNDSNEAWPWRSFELAPGAGRVLVAADGR
ncbi:MAG: hypothetical protein AAFZ87_12520, partial [Planctomycetota bacterium]